ncbi:LysR family transcriptional regulator [Rhodovulum sulfidophilum]|uniref:LysR family transcriptional regulator n=2 Tax=Rhodovulum sulfidophilum TaxID=35806 RepID=A0A0D6B403_RHOSU|nr:LysR family transcriptional regulator [Rhodovulum sulfidophilum]MBK5923971.1 LysR family transcriptional regulator [Rhodovulum sulfidophilum]MBL3551958.1 LysR family transcriptional regulator [Rhodovulum sulfidophilum]MBL3560493.1 LysR family transcriptional regulator [Rhodovulum sulfidophilum]MCE8418766.1 LysR family transcriptional regulator [Rhodovulum sulfidophilum]MCE8439388.1 LysR family transcriptional regulator [Rhodovulum sulfidophilum]
MNWDDMRLFLAVARAESLTGAGKALRLDPATLGRRIARLEEGLGAALFARSPRGYGLTEAGERLMARASEAEQALTEGIEELRGQEGQLTGAVRIGAPDGVANYLLPQVAAAICDRHPGLEVQIVALARVFNLSRREADMAIAVSPPKTGRLTVQRIADYQLHLAAHRDYLAAHPPIRDLADLAGHRIVGYIPDMIFDRELDYLAATGVERVALGSNSVSVQLNWLRTGAGLGIVHDFALPAAPGLVRVLPDALALRRSFYLIRHGDDRKHPRLTRFAGLLLEGLREELLRLEGLA